jgi:predicted small integral membrane protein
VSAFPLDQFDKIDAVTFDDTKAIVVLSVTAAAAVILFIGFSSALSEWLGRSFCGW